MEELTRKQKFISNLTAGLTVIAAGVFLLLCGLNAIPLEVGNVTLITVFTALTIIFLINGFVQKNTVSIWIGTAFFVPALVELLILTAGLTYRSLYPLYIALPAIASLVTAVYTFSFKPHLWLLLSFGVVGAIFAFESSAVLDLGVVLPIFIVYIGVLVTAFAIYFKKFKPENDDGAEQLSSVQNTEKNTSESENAGDVK